MKSLFLVRTKTFNFKNTTDLSIIDLHVILGFPQWFFYKVSEGRSFNYRVDDCEPRPPTMSAQEAR